MDSSRPYFHVAPSHGWMNDPNGLVYFKGYYHIFYQYYPNDVVWGPMHWGHVRSRDLLHFEEIAPALYPDDELGMCFSGSAIVKEGLLYLLYTAFRMKNGQPFQEQALAVSEDGVHFHKEGIVISSAQLPSDYLPSDFRDPSVFQSAGHFYLLAAAKKKAGTSNLLLYESEDLRQWRYRGPFLRKDSSCPMLECPSFAPEQGLLLTSEQFATPEEFKHLNEHSNRYYWGHFSPATLSFEPQHSDIVDSGFDFYAPQLFLDQQILIGWLAMWDRDCPTRAAGFAGMLTCPRRVKVVEGELFQTPIVSGEFIEEKKDATCIRYPMFKGHLTLDIEDCDAVHFSLNQGEDRATRIDFDGAVAIFDRSRSGVPIQGKEKDEWSQTGQRFLMVKKAPRHHIELVLDTFSAELFVDGKSMSNQLYALPSDAGFELLIQAKHSLFRRYVVRNALLSFPMGEAKGA